MYAQLKPVVLGLALITLVVGLSVCAKRPVLVGGMSTPAPSAAVTPEPTR